MKSKVKRRAFLDHIYRCTGENFIRGIEIGFCGEEKRLIEWFMLLFPDYEEEELIEKYRYYSKEYFIDYVYVHSGRRIERCKK